MYLMETAIGQYSQLGPVSMWRMAPVMKGQSAVTQRSGRLTSDRHDRCCQCSCSTAHYMTAVIGTQVNHYA